MKNLIYLIFISLSTIINAQPLFQKTYGSFGVNKIIQTTDSALFMLSSFNQGQFGNVLLVKTNALGDTLWTKAIGDSGLHYDNFDLTPAENGGCVVLIGVGFTPVCDTLLLIKFDASGNWLWDKAYYLHLNGFWVLSGIGWLTQANIVNNNDGGYFLSVTQKPTSFNYNSRNYVMRLDSIGNTLWTRQTPLICDLILQTPDSGFVMGGTEYSMGPGNYQISVSKMDKSGNLLWTHLFSNSYIFLDAIKQTHDGGFILVGRHFQLNAAYSLSYMIRTNSLGDTIWIRGFNINYLSFNNITDIIETPDGGFMVCEKDLVTKTDSLGIPVWSYKYFFGNIDTEIKKILPSTDGGYLLEGYKNDSISQGTLFIAKIDSTGNSNCVHTSYTSILVNFSVSVGSFGSVISASIPSATILFNISSGSHMVNTTDFCSPTGIETITSSIDKELAVYPNPANNLIHINCSYHHMSEIIITDILGKILYHQTSVQLPLQINISSFPEGMYNISVRSDKGISNKVFIITR